MRAPWNHNIQYFPLFERVARATGVQSALDIGSGDGMLAARLARTVPVVVGLARESGPVDWALSILSVPISRMMRARRGWHVHGAPTHDPVDDFATVRRISAALLPGSRFRRHLFWRYSLVWTSPRQSL